MRTLIVTNRSTSPQRLDVLWPGTVWKEMERVSQYSENESEPLPAELIIQPGEIITFSTTAPPGSSGITHSD
jgi:hypothetical protein